MRGAMEDRWWRNSTDEEGTVGLRRTWTAVCCMRREPSDEVIATILAPPVWLAER